MLMFDCPGEISTIRSNISFLGGSTMPENNRPGLLVFGIPREPDAHVVVEAGNDHDIEYTKRQARRLVEGGSSSRCIQSFIVGTVFSATPDSPPDDE